MLIIVPLMVAVVAKDNLATGVQIKMAARAAGVGKIHCGSRTLQQLLAALRLLVLRSQGGQSKAHKEEASS